MFASAVVFCVLALASSASSASLPSDFKTCSLSDANADACLRESIGDAMAKLANGNKDLGMAPLDPYTTSMITFEKMDGPISLKQVYRNVVFKGFSKSKINEFKVNLDGCSIFMKVTTPLMEALMEYDFEGNFMVVPVKAKGDVDMIDEDLDYSFDMKCELFDKDGARYLRITDVKTDLNTGKFNMKLGKFKEGNPELNEKLAELIHQNPQAFFEVIKPSAEKLFSGIVVNAANKIFTQVPVDDIFKK